MIQRILALAGYLIRSLTFSLSGVLYIIMALIYYFVMFQQRTPEVAYFTLAVGVFGGVATFLVTLSLAARANQAASYPLIVRLPSRVEYLTAVFLAAVFFATLLQLLVALLALLRNGPALSLLQAIEIPPVWLAVSILAATLALHASDFVTEGWSRVYLFGLLALLLFSQDGNGTLTRWLAELVRTFSNWAMRQELPGISRPLGALSTWLANQGSQTLGEMVGLVFWPFRAITEAAISGNYSRAQAFAPALLLLYATFLFLLAADLFAGKDLYFTED